VTGRRGSYPDVPDSGEQRLASAFAKVPALEGLPDHRAFERLAAMVFHHWLGEQAIHDITLRGESTAPHQIDVVVGDEGQRALIECKYYNRNIDMPVVRNFYGAVEDLGCAMAAIVTTRGFSENVRTYAEAKRIDLLVLRDVEEGDLEDRIQCIHFDFTAFHVALTACRVESPTKETEASETQMAVSLTDPGVAFEYASGRREPFAERYHAHYGVYGFDHADGVYPVTDLFEEPTWLVDGHVRVPVQRIDWEFTVSRSTTSTVVRHEPLVSLIDANGDVLDVVSEEQLQSMRFAQRPVSGDR
jgi:predicted RecB family endonuclease